MGTGRVASYRIDDIRIDTGTRCVFRDKQPVPLAGLSFDLLLALVRAAPNMLTHDELIEQVWCGRVVSPETVTQRVKLVRDALGDDSTNPHYIALVRGHGYRLVASVDKHVGHGNLAPSPRRYIQYGSAIVMLLLFLMALLAPRIIDRFHAERNEPPVVHSVAVIPFLNHSATGDQPVVSNFLANTLYDDLITRLAQVHGLTVISRTSSERYRNSGKSTPEIARELGVEMVLEGGVQQAGRKLRINAQLIDAASDTHIWARTYDAEASTEQLFDVQSAIARSIAEALQVKLTLIQAKQLHVPATSNLKAYEAYIVGHDRLRRRRGSRDFVSAFDHFQRAVDLDPGFARGWAGRAEAALFLWLNGIRTRDEAESLIVESAHRALMLDPQLGEAYVALAARQYYFFNDREQALTLVNKGIALSPNTANLHYERAMQLSAAGRFEESVISFERTLVLDPFYHMARQNLAQSLDETARASEARQQRLRIIETDPDFTFAYLDIAKAEWDVWGQLDESARWWADLATYKPATRDFIRQWPDFVWLLTDMGEVTAVEMILRSDLGEPDVFRLWSRLIAARYLKDEEVVAVTSRRILSTQPHASERPAANALLALRDVDIRNDRADEARTRYVKAYPAFFAGSPVVERNHIMAALDVARLLLETGEASRAARLLAATESAMVRAPHASSYLIARVHLHALRGERDAAFISLRQAIDSGWRARWWDLAQRSINLESLHGDARFVAVMAEIRADIASQRDAARSFLTAASLL